MNAQKQPYQQKRWSLTDLFPGPDSPELEAAFSTLETQTAEFEQRRSQLDEALSAGAFLEILQQIEKLNDLAYRLSGYANLWFTEDTQNQAALSLMARVDQFLTDLSNRLLFFNLWWKDVSDETAQRLMSGAGDYSYWLEEMRHFKPHTLSEAEEKIINIKNVTGSNALTTLYDSITNRYTFKIDVNGEEKELTRGELMVYARQHDPDLRMRAYQEQYRVYGNDAPILGQIYQTLVRDWRNEQMNLRKFSNPIAARNLGNDIPDAVVNTLLDVAQANTDVFQRFFALKARLLGMDRLRRYDIYAPLAQSDKQYTYQHAAEIVLDSFAQFDPQFAALAQRVLEKDHLDSEVRRGKRGGAFCMSTSPRLTPWVMLNFQGKPEDAATMAHELGHAVHAMLASDHNLFTFHSSLPLAETASTFSEMLLVDRLLAEETDEAVRRDLLFRQVDDAYATIQRQAFFALFERQAHELVHQGASVDSLAEAYMENLKQQFGSAVDVADEFRWEWVSIPHIYQVPFYVYAYSFGQLLVLSLYKQYKEEGEAFKPRYRKILSIGGSKAPVNILSEAGIDIYQSSFWQGGFDVIRGLVGQLENLPK